MNKNLLSVKITAVFILFIFSKKSWSQEIEWDNTIQGNSTDYLYAVNRCVEGGCIVGGFSFSNISGDKTENSNGAHDYWILRLDDDGNILWQNTIGGDDGDQLESIEQTSDGGFILGGWSASNISGDKTENSQGIWDYWVVKTDALGNIQWQNTIGGSLSDELISVRQTTDGGYILGGSSESPASGDKTENSQGDWDYWIVKLDSSGNIEWQNTIGGDTTDFASSVEQTKDGGYITCGYSYSGISGDKTEANQGYQDYWVVKLDSSGNIEWQNTIGGSSGEFLFSMNQCPDGGYIVGGNSGSGISGDKTEPNMGPSDYWIVKLDSSGNIQWQNTVGGDSTEAVYFIKATYDNGAVICGTSTSDSSGDKSENRIGSHDYWVVKLDSLGNVRWENTIGGTSSDIPREVCETRDGDYIVGGYSNSGISGDKSEGAMGNDYWVVKLTSEFNTVTGKVFYDFNSNSVWDAGEPAVVHNKIRQSVNTRFSFSQQDGSYTVSVADSCNSTITPTALNYYNPVPPVHNVYFSGFQEIDSLNDFAFQPLPGINDLTITITPVSSFRSGSDAYYLLSWNNIGTTSVTGTVNFFPDTNLAYITASVVPAAITTDSVTWNLGILSPLQQGSIFVTVHVGNGVLFNTLINSSVRIDPVTADNDTINNYSASEVFSVASLDPNDILVNRDTVFTNELVSPPWLEYIIRFQNTGNAPANNVHVLNRIKAELDLAAFEIVASSHPMNINYSTVTGYLDFGFENINLPDSNANEPASHGFISYRIKPASTLSAGNSITNTASIYFDLNAPVHTNTAVTRIVLPTSIEPEPDPGKKKIWIYPNPSRETFTIRFTGSDYGLSEQVAIKLFDLSGRKVFNSVTTDPEAEIKIDISGFLPGLYFLEFESGDTVQRAKLIKQ